MPFKPTDLDLEILDIVHGLQHRQDRQHVSNKESVVLDEGVPTSVIYAEVLANGRPCKDACVGGRVDELHTRGLLRRMCSDHSTWDGLEYTRPDDRIISTRTDPRTDIRWVLLDGKYVATEEHSRGKPRDDFARHHITEEGLTVLDSWRADEKDEDRHLPAKWFRDNSRISDDTLRHAKRKGRIRAFKGNGNRNHYSLLDAKKLWPHLFDS